MSIILMAGVVIYLTCVPQKGRIELSEREEYLMNNYRGFIDVIKDISEVESTDLIDDSVDMSATGQMSGGASDSNMTILGDIGDVKDSDVELDISKYL